MKIKEALEVLGFDETEILPKLKEIRRRYVKLSVLHHPDKNGGSNESKEMFQTLLNAYEVAGKACEDIIYYDDDHEDILARKMFKQFPFSSVTENTTTFTVKTEASLNHLWNQILVANFGLPDDLGIHGLKYTVEDNCNKFPSRIFITVYKKGKMLIQAEGNKHSLSSHFVNNHLEAFILRFIRRKRLQKTLVARTPVTKRTGRKAITKIHKCHKCDFQCTEIGVS